MPNYKNRIIIIDDSEFKQKDIKGYIKDINPNAEIHSFANFRNAMYTMIHTPLYNKISNQPQNCILFLDMMFPFNERQPIERDAGISVLNEMTRVNMNIDTIMISSDDDIMEKYNITEQYPFVKGHIVYNPTRYQKSDFETAITLPDKKA